MEAKNRPLVAMKSGMAGSEDEHVESPLGHKMVQKNGIPYKMALKGCTRVRVIGNVESCLGNEMVYKNGNNHGNFDESCKYCMYEIQCMSLGDEREKNGTSHEIDSRNRMESVNEIDCIALSDEIESNAHTHEEDSGDTYVVEPECEHGDDKIEGRRRKKKNTKKNKNTKKGTELEDGRKKKVNRNKEAGCLNGDDQENDYVDLVIRARRKWREWIRRMMQEKQEQEVCTHDSKHGDDQENDYVRLVVETECMLGVDKIEETRKMIMLTMKKKNRKKGTELEDGMKKKVNRFKEAYCEDASIEMTRKLTMPGLRPYLQ